MSSSNLQQGQSAKTRRTLRWFAFGNIAIACILVCADAAVPSRSIWLDAPVATEALALWVSGFGVLYRQRWAIPLLRAAAWTLLCFGLVTVAVLALSAAFLFGVHGHFLRDGLELVVIGFGLAIPYTLAYPLLLLATLKPKQSRLQT